MGKKEHNLERESIRVERALASHRSDIDCGDGASYCDVRCHQYAYVVENSPVSVVITDDKGLIEFVNPKFEEISGFKMHELVGKNPGIISSGETPREQYGQMWKTILGGGQWTGEFHNRRKNGELYWEKAVIKGVTDENGRIRHFIGIKEDITEVKEARRKLEQERLKLIQNSKMAEVGLMASGILHEVGNPIAAIRGIVCDIRESCHSGNESISLNKMVTQQLDEVLAEIDRITGITMDISEFTYSRNAVELLDINSLVNTTCRLVQYDARWSTIDLRVILDADLPPVYGVRDHMVQILINVLSNAAWAVGQAGDRRSSVHLSTFFDDSNIYISIKDNGCGISQEDLPKIFDTFFSRKGKGEGSGLGLAMCRTLIEEQHGKIEIFSQPGVRTEVCLSLPVSAEFEV